RDRNTSDQPRRGDSGAGFMSPILAAAIIPKSSRRVSCLNRLAFSSEAQQYSVQIERSRKFRADHARGAMRPSRRARSSSNAVALRAATKFWNCDLTDEEVRLLDTITKKLTAPVSNASPDALQNQIESKPAIEADG